MISSSSSSSAAPSSSSIAPSSSSNSSVPSISSSEISSSIDSSSSSSEPVVIIDNSLDGQIAQFLDGTDIEIPALNEYNLTHVVIYYYVYQQYMIIAQGRDLAGTIASSYLAKLNQTELVSQNDDDYYTVEDYGYLFADEDEYISINFFTEGSTFCFTLTRNDGEYGTLDVSNIDTNWYVDYVNLQGMELVDSLPVNDIKECLNLDPSLVLPTFPISEFVIGFESGYQDEDGTQYPDTFYAILEGDKISACVDLLKTLGFEAQLVENVGQKIDWDLFEIVDYTYYTGEAYDANRKVYISIYQDDYENTIVAFNNFEDLFCGGRTTATDWSDEEKALMNSTLHQLLPFMAFGEDYELYDGSDEDWDFLVLEDTYFEDLSEEYVALLLANGFVAYNDPDYGLLYKRDNGLAYIEIFVDYYNGNYLEIYFEESRIPAVTSLSLNKTALDIVVGGSFQLEASYTPKDAFAEFTWSSNNEDVATVSANGVVSINANAQVGASAVITATALNGVSASCTFTVVADAITAIEFAQDSYTLIPGGSVQTSFITLPVGATALGTVTFGIKDDAEVAGITYDENGTLSASESVAPGTSFEIYVDFNGSLRAYATVTVIDATVKHTLTREVFGIEKANYSKYLDYEATLDGATYKASCAGNNGIQIRSKNDPSGVIGQFEGRNCQSITFTFDANTDAAGSERRVDIYASNSPFTIADMFGSTMTKVGSIVFDKNNLTQTYTFTADYSYIGFRSNNGAIYLPSIEILWK